MGKHDSSYKLAERVKTWTNEWKQQGLQEGEAKVLRR